MTSLHSAAMAASCPDACGRAASDKDRHGYDALAYPASGQTRQPDPPPAVRDRRHDRNGHLVAVLGPGRHGRAAAPAASLHPAPRLHKDWRNHHVNYGASPVVGGGAVWAVDDGVLFQLSLGGSTITTIPVGDTPHFATPTLHGSLVLVGTVTGVTAISTS